VDHLPLSSTPAPSAVTPTPQIIIHNHLRSKWAWVFYAFLFVCVIVSLAQSEGLDSDITLAEVVLQGKNASEKIALIPVKGVITSSTASGSLFSEGVSTVAFVKSALEKAAKDDKVKAVLLAINSPGGEVTASDVIHHHLLHFRQKTGKPILALFQDISASGGYYIGVAANQIMAYPTTLTGSIGVIMQHYNVQELAEKVGVQVKSLKSGAHKDIASNFRSLAPEEEQILQKIIDEMYQRFVHIVDEGRPQLSKEQILPLADGRIYTAQQALENGLVDEIGYFEEAVLSLEKMAGISQSKVVEYRNSPSVLNSLTQAKTSSSLLPFVEKTQFLYLWESQISLFSQISELSKISQLILDPENP
jgi:protease-4